MEAIYGNSEFIKNKRSHLMDKCAHEREVSSAKKTKVLLIVLSVSLGFALGIICALSLLYAGSLRDIQQHNVSNQPADPVNMSFRTDIDLSKYQRVKEHLASCTEFIRSQSCVPCEDGWTSHNGKCYHFSSEKQTWFDSRLSCEALDAHLVIIETEKEQGFLASRIKVYHWIGLNDLDTEGRWVWVNNQTLEETVQFWLKRESGQSEPDNWKGGGESSGENCAIMRVWDQLHNWCDVSCKSNYNFICEKKPTLSFMHDDKKWA